MSTGGIPLPRINPRRIEPPPPPPGFMLEDGAAADMVLGDIPPPPAGFVMEATPAQPAAVPPPPPGFVMEEPSAGGTIIGEGLKAVGRGAGGLVETAIKAPPGAYAAAREYRHQTNLTDLEMLDRIERGEPPQPWNPGNRSLGLPGSAADRYVAMTPEERSAERQRIEADIAAYTPTDVKETALYKAGQGLGEDIRKAIPVTPGWEDSVTVMLGEGLGSVAAGIGAYAVGGPLAAGTLFTAGGSGEALDRAIEWDRVEKAAGRPGATPQQIAVAAIAGTVAGATDLFPIETALGVLKVPTPFRRPVAQAIARVGGQALVEGGQEGIQQIIQNVIAQQTYDPEQEIGEGVAPNVAAGAGVGGIVQGVVEALVPGRQRGGASRQTVTEEQAPAPAPAPTVTPEQPPAPAAAQPQTPIPEDATIEEEPARAITDLPQDEVAMLRGAGWTDEAILDMADEERVAAAEEARAQGAREAPARVAPEQRAPAAASPVEEAPVEPPPSPEVRAPEVAPVGTGTGIVEPAQGQAGTASTAAAPEGPDGRSAPVRAEPDVGGRADRGADEERAPIRMFDPRSLKVAPKRFQFRENTDVEGLAPTLKGVQKWRPERGNQIIVWQDKAGDQYVVDGHQRTGLAKRLMEEGKEKDIQIPGVVLREQDGVSAEEATTLASLKNIAEGSASPIEAAKVLRAAGPERLSDLPMPKDAVRSAVDLSKLAEEPFRMVVNGVVEPNYAKYVGRLLAEDEARQIAAMKALARAEVSNEDEAAVLVRRVAAAELAKGEDASQTDMFGETPDSTALEEIRIVAGAMRQLRRDKTLFAKVASEADRIEKTGSKIERDAAGQAAAEADRLSAGLDTIAFRAGPIRDRLKTLATEVKNERRPLSEARNLFVDALRSGDEVAGEAGRGAREPERKDQGGGEQRQSGKGRKPPEKLAAAKVGSGPSWVIRRKSDGEVIFETFDRKKVDALNTEKYEAVPIGEYLGDLNRRIKDAGGVQPERSVSATTEEGADGRPQTVIPGAERVSDEELARRRQAETIARKQSEKRIAPKKPQRAADEGLFGEDDRQLKLFRTDGTPLPPVERRALENDLRSIIGRVAGRRVRVTFAETIDYDGVLGDAERAALENAAASAGASIRPTIGGFWQRGEMPGEALIAVATADRGFDPTTTAFHESWHQVEMALLNDQEIQVLQAEIPRLRAFAAVEIGRPVGDPYIQNLPDYEVSAIAFQRYARMKKARESIGGISIAVRRMFDKIAEVLRQVRATLKGRKINRYEDLFGRAYRGGYAARQEGQGAVEGALASSALATSQTETEAFKRWFRKSKVVNEDGSPRVVYHGTAKGGFDFFDVAGSNYGLMGQGAYFTEDPSVASTYTNKGIVKMRKTGAESPSVYPVFLSITNPIDMEAAPDIEAWVSAYSDYVSAEELVRAKTNEEAYRVVEENVTAEEIPSYEGAEIMQDGLRAMGFDGITHIGGNRIDSDGVRHRVWIAFEPEQIKSVANRGTFDPNNPSILAASIPFVGPAPGSILSVRVERFKARVRDATDPIRLRVQDRYLAIKRFQEKVEATTGIKIDTPLDVYQAIRLYTGKGGEKLVDLQDQHIEPLIEDMRARKVSGAELDDYLYARHAPERNREMAKINPNVGDSGSGMSDAEAQAIMDRIDRAGRTADFEALAQRVDDITSYTRRELVTAGLIDPKTALAWKTKYPNYVPLRGFDDPAASVDQEANVGLAKSGRGFDVRGKESQTALGRRSKADSPVAYVVQQAEMAIVRAEKNRALKTVLRFAQDPAVEPSKAFKVDKGETKRRINPQTGMVETYAVPPHFNKKDNIFAVKIGGKTHWLTVEDPGFARSLRGVGSGVDNALARALLSVSHTYAKLLTQWNPEFVPTNAVRDLQTALVNVSEFDSLAKGTRTKILKDAFTLKSIRGALASMYGKQTSNEMAAYYDEFRRAGGKVSYIELNDIDAIKKRIDRSVKAGDIRRAIGNATDLVGNLNTAVENGVRVSVYANLRKAGVDKEKAAFIARDLTTDFNLRGEWGPTINALYIFFNASIQGSFRLARAVARSKTARIAVAGIFTTGFGMEFLNALMAGGDDDDNPYDKIEDYEFERNMIIMLPGGDYIKLPLAYGYNVPFVAGQQLARLLRGKTEVGKAASMVGAVSMDSFNPIGATASFLQFVSPWMLDPFAQSAENKTFFGSPIMPTVYDEKKPLSETYWKSAPSWAKWVSRTLNEATGGNKGRPGDIDVSPETIQHYAEFAGGGVGRFLVNAYTTSEGIVTGAEILPEKFPFARRFYGKTDTGRATERRFFDAWAEVDQAHYEQLRLKEARDSAGLERAREDHRAELAAYGAFNSAQKTRKKLREARDAAEKIEDAAKRKERLDQIDEREQAIMEKALDVYRRAKGS